MVRQWHECLVKICYITSRAIPSGYVTGTNKNSIYTNNPIKSTTFEAHSLNPTTCLFPLEHLPLTITLQQIFSPPACQTYGSPS